LTEHIVAPRHRPLGGVPPYDACVPLDYGETAFSGAIRCAIEPAGITCTDTSTNHFFRLSRESYELG
jgi:hypothetical protein